MKPIVSFDASAINRLCDPAAVPIIFGIRSGYYVRITATSIEELIATDDSVLRTHLLDTCQSLVADGDVLLPFHEVIRRHILEFEKNSAYDWRRVYVEAPDYRREIVSRELITDRLSREQREHADNTREQFEDIYRRAHPHFLEIFQRYPDRARPSAEELLEAFRMPGGTYWAMGAGLYKHVVGSEADEPSVVRFDEACPPFRSLLCALILAQHDRVIAEVCANRNRKPAGRIDILSATYLPYCDEFFSDDKDEQRFMRKVVILAALQTKISWCRGFMEALDLGRKFNFQPLATLRSRA